MVSIRKIFDSFPFLFLIVWLVYAWFESQYDNLIIISFLVILVLKDIIEFILFRVSLTKLIKLGRIKEFDIYQIFKIIGHVLVISLLTYLFINLKEFTFFKFLIRENNFSLTDVCFLYILPGLFFSHNFSDSYIYMSEIGLLKQRQYFEFKKWSDFCSYKIIEDLSLIRFKNKDDKFFFIEYDEAHFKESKEEILSFLNKKLKNDE